MATKQLGTSPSASTDTATRAYVEASIAAGIGLSIITNEIPVGIKDGVNDTFTLVSPARPNSVAVYRNGLREVSGIGFIETDLVTITFSTPPLTTDDITTDYITE